MLPPPTHWGASDGDDNNNDVGSERNDDAPRGATTIRAASCMMTQNGSNDNHLGSQWHGEGGSYVQDSLFLMYHC